MISTRRRWVANALYDPTISYIFDAEICPNPMGRSCKQPRICDQHTKDNTDIVFAGASVVP